MKIIKCPVREEIEVQGEKLTCEFGCSLPIRFLGIDEITIYLPEGYDEEKFIEDYKNNMAS